MTEATAKKFEDYNEEVFEIIDKILSRLAGDIKISLGSAKEAEEKIKTLTTILKEWGPCGHNQEHIAAAERHLLSIIHKQGGEGTFHVALEDYGLTDKSWVIGKDK
jgi:hypothetical protein